MNIYCYSICEYEEIIIMILLEKKWALVSLYLYPFICYTTVILL